MEKTIAINFRCDVEQMWDHKNPRVRTNTQHDNTYNLIDGGLFFYSSQNPSARSGRTKRSENPVQ